ncbi:cytokine receptor isoform X2 [Anthonomus grandis grandis]|uniref:cytokine receptor isoform X2 n=1 Tax=Anthonomus grandis grandis TaxID=2921223 RepID=UPI0021668BFE|nr:cytokine receptor isoform X2 [Anthonomus grandis grandis]
MMAHLRHTFLICLSLFVNTIASSTHCGPGITSAGYTYPAGDITLRYGEDLEIICVLNEKGIIEYGPNASDQMYYMLNRKRMPVEKINSTAIRYYIRNHPKTNWSDYVCMINGSLVCHNVVVVGIPPQKVTDFNCMGKNLESFTCDFTPPNNCVTTSYRLLYFLKAGNTSIRNERSAYECPKEMLPNANSTKLSCTWSITTDPQYRHSWPGFTFRLIANNTFGTNIMEFPIENFANTRPDPPVNLTGVATGSDKILIRWDVPTYIQVKEEKLVHKISWCMEHYKNWTTKELRLRGTKLNFTLNNLPYAHWLYEIKVSTKMEEATEDKMWSKESIIIVRTLSKIPDSPPKTIEGSFEYVEPTRSRLVCWQRLKRYQENGNDTSYVLEGVGDDTLIEPLTIRDSNCLKYDNLPDTNYTFKIWAKNEVGMSKNYSTVFFPATRYVLKPVVNFVKSEQSNGVYLLWWRKSDDERVRSYTLFWCSAQKEWPYTCDGSLNWKTYSPEINNVTLKLDTYDYVNNQSINIYHFAISANGAGSSTGMLWAACSYIPKNGVKFSQLYVESATARSLSIHWMLKCVKLDDVLSFNVSYCPSAEGETNCLPNSLRYTKINGRPEKNEGNFDIVGLKPYTTYIICVKPVIQDAESQFSKAMFNHTKPDYPTVPLNLNVDVEEKQLTIRWDKPEEENGHTSVYKLSLNSIDELNVQSEKDKQHYEVTIKNNILPRHHYVVGVQACNELFCSNRTIRSVKTPIGDPGQVALPSWNFNNITKMARLNWEKPGPAGVKVDYYEVNVGSDETHEKVNASSSKMFYEVSTCVENKSERELKAKVRAINIREDGKLLHGSWSELATAPCDSADSSTYWGLPIIILSVVFLVVLLVYAARMTYYKVRSMCNYPKVLLPPELNNVIGKFDQGKEKLPDEMLPGEPLLPEKIMRPINPSGDTSGCCSGAESVSSVESGGVVSLDSGTSQMGSPNLDATESKDVALRQRPNVKKGYVTMSDLSEAPWATKPPQTGYSSVGILAPPMELEYTSLADITPKSSYVPFAEAVSDPAPASSGYVPHLTQEPASKNTPYVLAGQPTPAPPKSTKFSPILPVYTLNQEELTGPYGTGMLDWQPEAIKEPVPSSGYVMVGETKPLQKPDITMPRVTNKGYVPHNMKLQESVKALKED